MNFVTNDPKGNRMCPACNLMAVLRYKNELNGKWVYKHRKHIPGRAGKRLNQTTYCEADK